MAVNRADALTPVRPPVCSRCGEGILGSYVQALDRNWHLEHFVCGGCGKPIRDGGFIEVAKAAYHQRCHADRFATKCFYCGEPMVGKYVRDVWGIEFCQSHIAETTGCVFCGRLVDGCKVRGRTTEAGLRCGVCGQTAVDTPEDAAPLYAYILKWATDRDLLVPAAPLQLTDVGTLTSYGGASKRHRQLGVTRVSTTTSSGIAVKVEILCIAVLRGLPRVLFGAVAAHEAGHAWLRATGIDGLSPAEEEGFCELLAFIWLCEESTPDRNFYAERIANNDDAVYGDGFRHVRALSDSYGFRQLIDSLRKTKRLPYGSVEPALGDR